MSNELVTHKETQDFVLLQRMAKVHFESGDFPSLKGVAGAISKMLLGKDFGLSPSVSLTSIHVVQGKPVLSANIIAALIDRNERYDYRITTKPEDSEKRCDIKFFKDKEELGTVSFTMEEAQRAGLSGKDNWKKYPSDMLFARAISRAARRFAPSIFGGNPVYTEDEGEEFGNHPEKIDSSSKYGIEVETVLLNNEEIKND